MMEGYKAFATKYAPGGKVKVLFVAEAPPCSAERYFYFENVHRGDWLWIALMKALYHDEWKKTKTKHHRGRKAHWLETFADSGYQLIDAVKVPIDGSDNSRVARISRCAPDLIAEIERINPEKIVLIKKTVHDALFRKFQDAGLFVANEHALPFPCAGWQTVFHDKISSLNLS